jgi:hypothetical protein
MATSSSRTWGRSFLVSHTDATAEEVQSDDFLVRTRWVDYKDHEFDPYVNMDLAPIHS